jgi:hypothetical protein
MFRRIEDTLSSNKRALRVTVVVMLLALTFSLVACAGSIPALEAATLTSSPELNLPVTPAITAKTTTVDTFRVTGLEVYPTEVKPGEQILVTASIVNTGDLEANYTVELKVNEIVKFATEVKLPAGDTGDLQVVGREVVPGIYTVNLGGLTRQFVVRELTEPQDGGGPILLGNAEPENIVTEPEQNAGACCGGGATSQGGCGCGGSSPSQSDNGLSSHGGCGCGQQTKILPGDTRQY